MTHGARLLSQNYVLPIVDKKPVGSVSYLVRGLPRRRLAYILKDLMPGCLDLLWQRRFIRCSERRTLENLLPGEDFRPACSQVF